MTELTELKFSGPIARYQSIATYKNSEGQDFIIRVSGCNDSQVKRRIKNLRAFFEVSLEQPEKLPGNASTLIEGRIEPTLSQEIFALSGDEGNKDVVDELDVSIEVAAVPNIKRAHTLKLAFSNIFPERHISDIGTSDIRVEEGSDVYIIPGQIWVDAHITVSAGSAKFTMCEASTRESLNWKSVASVEVSPGKPKDLTYRGSSQNWYKLQVNGGPGTDYTINGDWIVA